MDPVEINEEEQQLSNEDISVKQQRGTYEDVECYEDVEIEIVYLDGASAKPEYPVTHANVSVDSVTNDIVSISPIAQVSASPVTDISFSPVADISVSPVTNIHTSLVTDVIVSPDTNTSVSPVPDASASPVTNISACPVTDISGSPDTDISVSPVTDISVSPVADIRVSPVADIRVSPVTSISASPVTEISISSVTDISVSPVTNISASPVLDISASPITNITASPVKNVSASHVTDISISPVTSISASPVTDVSAGHVTNISISPVADISVSPVTSISASPGTDVSASHVIDNIISPITDISISPDFEPCVSPVTDPNIVTGTSLQLHEIQLPSVLKMRGRPRGSGLTAIGITSTKRKTENEEPKKKMPFNKMLPVEKDKIVLGWLVSSFAVDAAMEGKVLQREDVKSLHEVSRASLDENVGVNRARRFFSESGWKEVLDIVEKVKEIGPLCTVCYEDFTPETSIKCESCIERMHFKCAGLKQKPKRKTWYCRPCIGVNSNVRAKKRQKTNVEST